MTSEKIESLLVLAAEDLAVASAATTPPRPAAYHLSQAVEKASRAICEHEGLAVGITHNIGQIGALLPADHPWRSRIEALNYMSPASTKYRYPDPAGRLPRAPGTREIMDRVSEVASFLDDVRQFVGARR